MDDMLFRYVHRVGRTARAGKAGTAITLSEEKQVSFQRNLPEPTSSFSLQVKNFLKMMREGGVNGIAKSDVGEEELGELREEYKVSLEKTKLELEEEKHQRQRKQVKRKAESTNVSFSGGKKRKSNVK